MQGDRWGASGDDLIAAFSRWSAQERAADAARSRTRERSLREQAAATATWAGALVDLAENGSRVVLLVGAGRLTGTIEAVGPDFCVLVLAGGRPVLVNLARIAAVLTEATRGKAPAAGSRLPAVDLSLAAALSLLAEERAPVHVAAAAGHQVSGDLVGMGEDVLTIRSQGAEPAAVLVPLANVEYCELR